MHIELNTNNYIVIGSPNSGIPGGKGYADKLGIPYAQYLRKKPDCGRTFILPNQTERLKYLEKFDIDIDKLKGKNIILVDDSIVRGTTSKELIGRFKEHGCKVSFLSCSLCLSLSFFCHFFPPFLFFYLFSGVLLGGFLSFLD